MDAFRTPCERRRLRRIAGALALGWVALLASPALGEAVVTPDRPEYVEKITEEQLAVALAETPARKAGLCMDFARERIREMEAVAHRRQFEHVAPLVGAWEALIYEGALEAARQGSANRHDMTSVLQRLERVQTESAARFERMSGEGFPEEAARALRRAAERARLEASRSKEAASRERVRAAEHTEALRRSGEALRAELAKREMKEAEARAAVEGMLERVRTHARVRVGLMSEVFVALRAGGAEGAAEVAAGANGLAEAGAGDAPVLALVRVMARLSVEHREMTRVLREIGRLSERSGEAEPAPLANRASSTAARALEKGLGPAGVRELLREAHRWMRDGVPGPVLLEALEASLEEAKPGSPRGAGEALALQKRALDRIRENLRNTAERYRERVRLREGSANGKGGKKGPGGS